ncbi:MAG TPA: hypothetical protein VF988_04235, partial [Verrucomicrobiae bacterium]
RTDGKEDLLVLINFSNRPVDGKVELKNAAGFTPLKIGAQEISGQIKPPSFHLNGFEWRVLQRTSTAVASD